MTLRPLRHDAGSGARLEEGWLVVPFAGDDLARVDVGVAPGGNGVIVSYWEPAFLSYAANGERVAQVRPHKLPLTGTVAVWLRVNGVASPAGSVTL